MPQPEQPQPIPPDKWPGLLTDDLKAHFERVGEELVSHDVAGHNYSTPEKHFAAIHWLGTKREARDRRSNWSLIVATLTLIAATAAVAVGLD